MDDLFLDEFDTPVDLQHVKEIQIHNKNNMFNMNISNDNNIDDYNINDYNINDYNINDDINSQTIIHKQENISDDTNDNKIYDISSLFLKPITYNNILISNIENDKITKSSNKMMYNLTDEYSKTKLFTNIIGFRLSEFIMSVPVNNILEDMYLYSDKDLKNKIVTIEKGLYTIHQLLNKINTFIPTLGKFKYDAISCLVNYNKIDNTTLYQNKGGLLSMLGFDKPNNNTDIVSIGETGNAGLSPNLLKGTFLDIVVEEIPFEACKRTCYGKYIVGRIPLLTHSSINDIIYYDNKQFNCNYEANNLFYPINISQLTISLFLDNKEVPFNNLHYSFEFELTVLNK